MSSFLKSLLRKRWLRWTLFAAGGLAATYFGCEWWAERQWQQYAAEARARGVKLTVAEWASRPPVGEKPVLLPLWQSKDLPPYPFPLALPWEGQRYDMGHDLAKAREGLLKNKWLTVQEAVGSDAEVVLLSLRRVEVELRKVLQGAGQPQARYALDWNAGWERNPQLDDLLCLDRYLDYKIHAEIAVGHADVALANWLAAWAVARAENADGATPEMADHYYRSIAKRLLQQLSAGLARGLWDDAQLQVVERQLAGESGLRSLHHALGAQRVALNGELERRMAAKDTSSPWRTSHPKFQQEILWAYSHQHRWWRSNQLWIHRYFDEAIAAVDVSGERWIPPPKPQYDPRNLRDDWFGLQLFLARSWCSSPRGDALYFIMLHTQLRMAALGCALERCRRATGDYPVKLADLVPEFVSQIPHDPRTGDPYRYRRDPIEGYLLYSTGMDGKDVRTFDEVEYPPYSFESSWRWFAPLSTRPPPIPGLPR